MPHRASDVALLCIIYLAKVKATSVFTFKIGIKYIWLMNVIASDNREWFKSKSS